MDIPAEDKPAPTHGFKGYRLFRILGFEVKLNPTWLLLALLINWMLLPAGGPVSSLHNLCLMWCRHVARWVLYISLQVMLSPISKRFFQSVSV